jgi:hypothetical protein
MCVPFEAASAWLNFLLEGGCESTADEPWADMRFACSDHSRCARALRQGFGWQSACGMAWGNNYYY